MVRLSLFSRIRLVLVKWRSSLHQVAQATVSFSRGWKDGLSSADAYWVKADQIKKGAPTGQFLPKGSFVIEGKRNYIKGVEIRLALGIMQKNNNGYALFVDQLMP